MKKYLVRWNNSRFWAASVNITLDMERARRFDTEKEALQEARRLTKASNMLFKIREIDED